MTARQSDAPDHRRPTFVVAGAPKAGTTSLYHYLAAHPGIFLPHRKEILFFDASYEKGLEWYTRHFRPARPSQAIGDISPTYMSNPVVPKRMSAVLPDAKTLFVLRNPIERAYSHYWDLLAWEGRRVPFLEMLTTPRRYRRGHGYIEFDILEMGYYWKHIMRFLDFFPRDQVGIFFFEDMQHDVISFLKEIVSFLGVAPCDLQHAVERTHNARRTHRSKVLGNLLVSEWLREIVHDFIPYRLVSPARGVYDAMVRLNTRRIVTPDLTTQQREYLAEKYTDDVSALGTLVDRDLSHWLNA